MKNRLLTIMWIVLFIIALPYMYLFPIWGVLWLFTGKYSWLMTMYYIFEKIQFYNET